MSDIFGSIRGLLPEDALPPPEHFDGPYRVFTTAHDRVVTSEGFLAIAGESSDFRSLEWPDLNAIDQAASKTYEHSARRLVSELGQAPLSLAVSVLLDHSGSTRGEKIGLIATLAGLLSECFRRLDIAHEILGYTTVHWKGGSAAHDWRVAGRPLAPGRLCDLLHVVHRPFDEEEALSWEAMEIMTNPYLLKENVDGEALQWAMQGLGERPEQRKLLIVVSDGAPVDDATLTANGPNILDDHLIEACKQIVADGRVELYGIGIGYEMGRYYPQYCIVRDAQDIGLIAIPVLQAILANSALAPMLSQFPEREAD